MNNKKLIKRLVLLFKPYRKNVAFIITGLILSSMLSLVIPILNKNIVDDGFLKLDIHKIMFTCLLLFLVILVSSIMSIIIEYLRVNLYCKIKYQLFKDAFDHLLIVKLKYFTNKSSTEILSNIEYDLNNIIKIADQDFFSTVIQICNMIGAIIGLFIINYKLTIILLLSIPIKYIIVQKFSKKREYLSGVCIKKNKDFAKWFGDNIDGIKEIRQFNISSIRKKQFEEKQKDIIKINRYFSLLDSCNLLIDSMFFKITTVLIYIISAYMLLNLNITIGSIFAFITYSEYIITPMYSILNIKYILAGILPSVKNFYEFLDLQAEETIKNSCFHQITGKIEFKNVQFSYDNKHNILNNTSFTIEAGEKVAIVGENGAGKSTILSLILRFYKPNEGSIFLDDIDINKINIKQYRDFISAINQQVYLFNGTIKENILLYKNIDSNKFSEIIEESQLSKFISDVGEDYIIDPSGKNLSGGQKQKIAIARALIRDTPIVIFDEATSNLDVESATKTYKLIDTVLKNKTIIIISHKAEILKHVDKVILIDNGSVSAIGNHKELLTNNAIYKNMLYNHYIK